jgi:DNA-binding CsgD family transcriptional regulator
MTVLDAEPDVPDHRQISRLAEALGELVDRLAGHLDQIEQLTATAPDTGWTSLTPAEVSVVQVIATGQTNGQAARQLALSPHTVSSHLRRAYHKLNINSRVELTRLVLTRGTTERAVRRSHRTVSR